MQSISRGLEILNRSKFGFSSGLVDGAGPCLRKMDKCPSKSAPPKPHRPPRGKSAGALNTAVGSLDRHGPQCLILLWHVLRCFLGQSYTYVATYICNLPISHARSTFSIAPHPNSHTVSTLAKTICWSPVDLGWTLGCLPATHAPGYLSQFLFPFYPNCDQHCM